MSQPNVLKEYPLPYTVPQPPPELFCDVETESGRSGTTAFKEGLDCRDVFLGVRRCIVCGYRGGAVLRRCHIIGHSDVQAWQLLKQLGWAPAGVRGFPGHETHNGLTMCANHQVAFNGWMFFIRFQPTTEKYIFVLHDSYNAGSSLEEFDGKAVALDIKDCCAPLPLLLLVHEYMVRGRNFYPPAPKLEVTNDFQDWLVNDGVVSEQDGSFSFKRKAPTSQSSNVQTSTTIGTQATQTSGPPAGGQSVEVQASPTAQATLPSGSRTAIEPPTADLVEELMAFQRTMPSYKALQRVSMGWEGTAEENTKKYVENIDVESVE